MRVELALLASLLTSSAIAYGNGNDEGRGDVAPKAKTVTKFVTTTKHHWGTETVEKVKYKTVTVTATVTAEPPAPSPEDDEGKPAKPAGKGGRPRGKGKKPAYPEDEEKPTKPSGKDKNPAYPEDEAPAKPAGKGKKPAYPEVEEAPAKPATKPAKKPAKEPEPEPEPEPVEEEEEAPAKPAVKPAKPAGKPAKTEEPVEEEEPVEKPEPTEEESEPVEDEPKPAPKTHVIKATAKNGKPVFIPSTLEAATGDTVVFEFLSSTHSVARGSFDKPCVPVEDVEKSVKGFFSGVITADAEDVPKFSIEVKDSQPIWYYCSVGKHCQVGMVGVINPSPGKTCKDYATLAAQAPKNVHPKKVGGGVTKKKRSFIS